MLEHNNTLHLKSALGKGLQRNATRNKWLERVSLFDIVASTFSGKMTRLDTCSADETTYMYPHFHGVLSVLVPPPPRTITEGIPHER